LPEKGRDKIKNRFEVAINLLLICVCATHLTMVRILLNGSVYRKNLVLIWSCPMYEISGGGGDWP